MSDPATEDWKRRALAAERAVGVLKRKVVSLYDGRDRSAIAKQLDRAKMRDASNRRRREIMQVRQQEMERYARGLEGQVHARTRAIRKILDNVTVGFLLVDRELRVCPGVTASCEELFVRHPYPGTKVAELFGLRGAALLTFEMMLTQIFEDVLPEEVSLEQLPPRFYVDDRVLRLDTKVIRDEQGVIEQLLFTVSDATALESARRRASENATVVTIVSRKAAFLRFLSDSRSLLDTALSSGDQILRRRHIHTVKGSAASWGLDEVVETIHALEDRAEITDIGLATVHAAFDRYLDKLYGVLGVRYSQEEDRTASIRETEMTKLRQLIDALEPSRQKQELLAWVQRASVVAVGEILGPLVPFSKRLAARLGKEVEVSVVGDDVLVDVEALTPILHGVTHLLRNAIDHGIEPPRRRGNKPRCGHLEVTISRGECYVEIEVSDDGQGIDVETLSAKAIRQGHVREAEVERWSPQEKLELVFCDGVSSAQESTTVSGRGVGMAAIRATARSYGGEVHVRSTRGKGTSIVIRVPTNAALRRAG